MPKFDNQTIQKENLLILEGNPPKPISCHRFDLLVTIQDFLVASEVLGYDPLFLPPPIISNIYMGIRKNSGQSF